MSTVIHDYDGQYRIVSLALDLSTKKDLMSEQVEFIYVFSGEVILYPEEKILTADGDVVKWLEGFNNYDVLEISENGRVLRKYDVSSNENSFFITGKCNSNCIICPSSDASRINGEIKEIDDLIKIASHIPADAGHITITGGEPFMAGKNLFKLLAYCKAKFEQTEFLLLTNGRAFAVNEYCELLRESIPQRCIIGIPLHGSSEKVHDMITQSPGSFRQTFTGLKRLLYYGIAVELRIVVCKCNAADLNNISKLIVDELGSVKHINIMAMEMTGNAYKNRKKVWISYKESNEYLEPAVRTLIENGLNVNLYNFPLCTVNRKLWTICAKSISSWKVRFKEVCEQCAVREACGGVFVGTLKLEEEELVAINEA